MASVAEAERLGYPAIPSHTPRFTHNTTSRTQVYYVPLYVTGQEESRKETVKGFKIEDQKNGDRFVLFI